MRPAAPVRPGQRLLLALACLALATAACGTRVQREPASGGPAADPALSVADGTSVPARGAGSGTSAATDTSTGPSRPGATSPGTTGTTPAGTTPAGPTPTGTTPTGTRPADGVSGGGMAASPPGPSGPSTSPGASGAAGAGSQATSPTGSPAPAPAGPASGEPVQIGIFTSQNYAAAVAALGVEIDPGDTRAQGQAVVDDINSRGGIDGRPIEPVFFDSDPTADRATTEQAACSHWTEDNHVIGVAGAVQINEDPLMGCLVGRGVAVAASNTARFYDAGTFATFPLLISPGYLNMTRVSPVLVERLDANGYFEPWDNVPVPKVGVLNYDRTTENRAVTEGLVPELQARGIQVVHAPITGNGTDQHVASVQSAALRFKTEAVSHVVFYEAGGGLVLYFAQAAEQQQYHPRYGLTSLDAPGAFLQTTVPPAQLAGAMGIGWIPGVDVDNERDPGPVSDGYTHCREIMEAAGQDFTVRATALASLQYCDTINILAATFSQAAGYDADGFRTMVDGLGTSFQSALTFSTNLHLGKRDGAGDAYDVAFDQGCSCFMYGAGPWQIPAS